MKVDKEKVKAWLDGKWTNDERCPICHDDHWSISDDFVDNKVFNPQAIFGGKSYPSVMIICTNCGYTVFINAIVAGFVEKKMDEIDK